MFKVKKKFEEETPGAGGGAPAVTPPVTTQPTGGAPASAAPSTSVTPPAGDPPATSKGLWPDDWHHQIVDGDEKLVSRVSRYASPKELAKALIETQNKIRSGEFKSALPKDAKPEEVAEWRKDNGIPEAPEKYDMALDNGVVIGKDDQPIVGGFLKAAHDKNYTPDQVKSALQWYYNEQERQTEERFKKDESEAAATTDTLNAEWGGNYRRNINMVKNLFSNFPDDVRDKFMSGRLADGTAILNHPGVVKGFAQIAHELNPASTVVPKGGDVVKTIDDELASIKNMMSKDREAYNKNTRLQERYRELLVAKKEINARK